MGSTTIPAPPAAAPAAASPAPAPAAVSSPAPEPVVSSSPAPEPQSAFDRISAGMEKVNKEIEDFKAAPEDAVEEPKPEPVAEPAAEPANEPAAEEKPAGSEDPEAAPADVPELDDGQSIAPTDLAKMIRESPELTAYFDKPENQEIKNKWFAMARRLEKGGAILRMIPNEAEAKELIATSAEYNDFDAGLELVSDAKSGLEFFDRLHNAFLTEKDGKQVANPALGHVRRGIFDDGLNYLVNKSTETGDIHPVLKPTFNKMVDLIEAKAKKENNADLQLAIEALREALPADARPQDAELPQHLKDKEAELNRREQEGTRLALEAKQQSVTTAFNGALELAAQSSADQARPRIQKAGLSATEADMAYQRIGERLEAELNENGLYKQRFKQLNTKLERDPSPENAQKLREHVIEYQNLILGKIISDVVNDITGGKSSRQTAKEQKVASQVEASRSEPRGVTASPTGPKTMTAADERAESEALWKRDNPGERMPLSFHLERMGKKIKAEIATTGR